MLIEIVTFLSALFREGVSSLSLKTKYLVLAGVIAASVMVMLDLLGLVIGPMLLHSDWLTRACVVFMLPVGLLLIGIVGTIYGSADVIQEILPESIKNEIKTTEALRIAARFVGINIGTLFIPIIFEVENNIPFYFVVLGCVGVLSFDFPKPKK